MAKKLCTWHWFFPICHKILPLVYDESLSYYEVLCKLMHKVGELIDMVNELIERHLITYGDEWQSNVGYPAYTLVTDENENIYISTQDTPAGVSLSNTDYWDKLLDMSSINSELSTIKSDVSGLETTVANHESRITALETCCSTVQSAITNLTSRVSALETAVSNINSQLNTLVNDDLIVLRDKSNWTLNHMPYVPYPEDDEGYAWYAFGRHVGLFNPKTNAPASAGGGALPAGVYWEESRWCVGAGGITTWGSTVDAKCAVVHNNSSPSSINYGTTDNKPKLIITEPHDGFFYMYAYNLDGTVYNGPLYAEITTYTPMGLLSTAQKSLIYELMVPDIDDPDSH